MLLTLSACDVTKMDSHKSIRIVATTNILGNMIEAIAPAHIEVVSLMKPGVDPHSYKASQGDLALLLSADIIFYQGLYLEGKMVNIFPHLKRITSVYEVSSALDRSLLIVDDNFPDAIDPHIWFSIDLWSQCVIWVSNILVAHFPDHTSEIEQHTTIYKERLSVLKEWSQKKINEINPRHRILISAHDAFSYLGRDYGLKVYSLQGISTLSDFGLKSISRINEIIIQEEVPAIFLETSVSDKSIKALLNGVKKKGRPIKIGGTLYSDSLGPKGSKTDDYFSMYQHNISTLYTALKKI